VSPTPKQLGHLAEARKRPDESDANSTKPEEVRRLARRAVLDYVGKLAKAQGSSPSLAAWRLSVDCHPSYKPSCRSRTAD
jgi:hypothetical protein